ncbi:MULTISPECIES: YuzL family protein [Sutcliffiella]|uniref:YuzL family protein n=1 Tax=Sutcliffiella cohnii TaxID=33932 RepID=A0A223KQS6_9BACI|nr:MULTISPECIES: YuzL family protein [Sutcliffiella]AST91737.1 hypothetical protein BC6307_10835 [Sutcliffiella cohnii]MED4014709.1 YuzL family protein [Sutcliffiella cohnii]WBL12952.1 YuzL family protein [Sutcliffiella sp. NC1]
MAKRKKNPAKTGLSSSQVEGQGTTMEETGSVEKSSSRNKPKKH